MMTIMICDKKDRWSNLSAMLMEKHGISMEEIVDSMKIYLLSVLKNGCDRTAQCERSFSPFGFTIADRDRLSDIFYFKMPKALLDIDYSDRIDALDEALRWCRSYMLISSYIIDEDDSFTLYRRDNEGFGYTIGKVFWTKKMNEFTFISQNYMDQYWK